MTRQQRIHHLVCLAILMLLALFITCTLVSCSSAAQLSQQWQQSSSSFANAVAPAHQAAALAQGRAAQ